MRQPLTVAAARTSLREAGFPIESIGSGTLEFWITHEHCTLEEVFVRAGWHHYCRDCAERAEQNPTAERARFASHEQEKEIR